MLAGSLEELGKSEGAAMQAAPEDKVIGVVPADGFGNDGEVGIRRVGNEVISIGIGHVVRANARAATLL